MQIETDHLQSTIYNLQWSDRALLSWLQRLIARVTASFRAYEYAAACEATERFFWGTLCDNYLEWVKGRLYDGDADERGAAQIALYHALLAILKLFAPIMPHIAEEIYQHLYGADGESIHVSAWPAADESLIDERAERAGEALLALTTAARRFKSAQKLGLGAELARITVATDDPSASSGRAAELRAALEQSLSDIRSVTRAREVAFAAEAGAAFEEAAPGLWIGIER